ncbi:RING-2 protein, partial [Magnaporthiopsis poae ATCC 64411]
MSATATGIKRKRDVGVGPETADKKRSARVTKLILYPTKIETAKATTVMILSHQDDEPTAIPRPGSVDSQAETTYNRSLPNPASQTAIIHNGNTGCHTPDQQRQALALIASHPRATAFDKRVWQLLVQIPRGHVSTYGAMAAHLASSPR